MFRTHQATDNRVLRHFGQFLLVSFDLRGEAVELGPVDLWIESVGVINVT
jgi:hypothetical protein